MLGNAQAQGEYLSLFLELQEGGIEPGEYQYQLELLSRVPDQPSFIRSTTSTFSQGECWGFSRYIKLESLVTQYYLDPEEDELTFVFHTRPLSYQQKCRDMERYIQRHVASIKEGEDHGSISSDECLEDFIKLTLAPHEP
jgi:tripartite motif-containing protein 37